jgi:NAD(P)H dehydrogenase (quinone)
MTTPVKVAIVSCSSSGTAAVIAEELRDAALKAGAEVRLVVKAGELAPQPAVESSPARAAATAGVPLATPEDIAWADAVLFGTPTRFGKISAQLKQFMGTLGGQWAQGRLADKVYSGLVSPATAHAGQETTLQSLYTSVQHFGGILVAPGFADPVKFVDGNPSAPRTWTDRAPSRPATPSATPPASRPSASCGSPPWSRPPECPFSRATERIARSGRTLGQRYRPLSGKVERA